MTLEKNKRYPEIPTGGPNANISVEKSRKDSYDSLLLTLPRPKGADKRVLNNSRTESTPLNQHHLIRHIQILGITHKRIRRDQLSKLRPPLQTHIRALGLLVVLDRPDPYRLVITAVANSSTSCGFQARVETVPEKLEIT